MGDGVTGMAKRAISAALLLAAVAACNARAEEPQHGLPPRGLAIDLDAERGVTLERGYVAAWESLAGDRSRIFEGRRIEGRPTVRAPSPKLNGRRALLFVKQELVLYDEDALDHLTKGSGYSWIAVIALGIQQSGWAQRERDLNAVFGNLRNGPQYEGFWAGVNEDGTLWAGPRNGRSFGRWNADNPKLAGPLLQLGRYYVVAGRLGSGHGTVTAELFVNASRPVAQAPFRVNAAANPSRLAIGQERDATDHPGKESFIGAIARFLVWDRPLSDMELSDAIASLGRTYGIAVEAAVP
jgi:hypothetical protein